MCLKENCFSSSPSFKASLFLASSLSLAILNGSALAGSVSHADLSVTSRAGEEGLWVSSGDEKTLTGDNQYSGKVVVDQGAGLTINDGGKLEGLNALTSKGNLVLDHGTIEMHSTPSGRDGDDSGLFYIEGQGGEVAHLVLKNQSTINGVNSDRSGVSLNLGPGAGDVGQATIDNSKVDVAQLILGNQGKGYATISNGSQFHSYNGMVMGNYGDQGAHGELNITGQGTSLETDNPTSPNMAALYMEGASSVNVNNGASFLINQRDTNILGHSSLNISSGGNININGLSGVTSILNMEDGSHINVNDGSSLSYTSSDSSKTIYINSDSDSNIQINNGGTFNTSGVLLQVSDSSGSPAIVMNGGTLKNTDNLSTNVNIGLSSGKQAVFDVAGKNITAAFAGTISGEGGINKVGSGTMVLAGNNTYTGDTTIGHNATLEITSDKSLGASDTTVNINGGTLKIGADMENDKSNHIFNVSDQNKSPVTLPDSLGGGDFSYTPGGTIDLNGHNYTPGGTITGKGGLTITSSDKIANGHSATLNLTHDNSYEGDSFISGLGGKPGAGDPTVTVNANSDHAFGNAASINVINGSVVNLNGNPSEGEHAGITLSGKGSNVRTDSILNFNNSSQSGSYLGIDPTATVNFNDHSSAGNGNILNLNHLFFNGNATADNATIKNDALHATIDHKPSSDVSIDISGLTGSGIAIGSFSDNDEGKMGYGGGKVELGSKTLTLGGLNKNDNISAIIEDGGRSGGTGGSLEKTGFGTLTLLGKNTYTGETTIKQGTLALSHGLDAMNNPEEGSIAQSSGVNISSLGRFDISGIQSDGTSIKKLSSDFGGNVILGDKRLTITAADPSKAYNGSLSGNGGLTIAGGTEVLGGDGSYTGQTVIDKGAGLTLSSVGNISNSSSVKVDGTFDIAGATIGRGVINSLSGSGAVQLGKNNLILANAKDTFDGIVSGNGGVTVAHGTETLTGVNDYTGATEINQGATLALSGNGSISGSSGVKADGTFNITGVTGGNAAINSLSGSGAVQLGDKNLTLADAKGDFGGIISGNGGVTVAHGNETFTGVNSYTGVTTINSGAILTLQDNGSIDASSGFHVDGALNTSSTVKNITTGSLSGSGELNIGGSNLTLVNAHDTFSGNIGGSGVTIAHGTETFTGANYVGLATVNNEATLVLSGNGSISGASGVQADGKFDISGVTGGNAAINSLSGSGAVQLGANNLTLTGAKGDFGGIISGNGGVTVTGGTETFTGVNGYTGTTTIKAGAGLILSGSGSISASSNVLSDGMFDISGASGGNVTINSLYTGTKGWKQISTGAGGKVILGSNNLTLANASGTYDGKISGSGNVIIAHGNETFSNGNDYTGATIINNGATLASIDGENGLSQSSGIHADGTLDLHRGYGYADQSAGGLIKPLPAKIKSLSGGSQGKVLLGESGFHDSYIGGHELIITHATAEAGNQFAGVISGIGGVTIAGGQEIFAGVNEYTGATKINQGAVLALSGGGSINASSGVQAEGTFDVSGVTGGNIAVNSLSGSGAVQLGGNNLTLANAQGTFGGAISGSGGVTIAGGQEIFTGVNGYTGVTTINQGAGLALSGIGSISASSGVQADGTFDVSGVTGDNVAVNSLSGSGAVQIGGNNLTLANAQGTFGGAVSGSGGVTVAGGQEIFTGVNNYTGATTINQGASLALSGTGSISASSGVQTDGTFDVSGVTGGPVAINTLTGNGAVQLGGNNLTLANAQGTFGGAISGSGGVTIAQGNETFTGNNYYTGVTAINQGAGLALSGSGSISASSVQDEGTFDVSGVTGGNVAVNSLSGNGAVQLGGNNLTLANAQSAFGGVVSGSGGVTVAGGQEIFTGVNNYTGATTINQGASLALSGTGSISASSGVQADGTFDVSDVTGGNVAVNSLSGSGAVQLGENNLTLANAQGTFGGAVSGSGGVIVAGGQEIFTGVNNYTGATTINQGASLALSGTGSISASSGVQADGTFDVSGVTGDNAAINSLSGSGAVLLGGNNLTLTNAQGTFGGVISGSGGVTVAQGNEIFAGADSYTGATTINQDASLALSGTGSISASSGVQADGTFDVSGVTGGNAAINTLSGNGAVKLGENNLTLANAQGTFGGVISGNGGVTIAQGSEIFAGADSYTGATTISQGAGLALSGNGSISASSGVQADGTFDVSGVTGGPVTIHTLSGSGVVQLGGNNLALANAQGTFSGAISGNGGVTVTGGQEIFTGVNGYTGATTINQGAGLVLSGSGSISDSSGVRADGTFDVSGVMGGNVAVNSLSGSGAVRLGAHNLTLANAQGTFGGAISGSGGVTVAQGSETFTGNNNYTGATTINQGASLALSGIGSISASSGVQADGTFDVSGVTGGNVAINSLSGSGAVQFSANNLTRTQTLTLTNAQGTFGGVISGNGGVTVAHGSETFAGADSYTGATTINQGAGLSLSGNGSISASSGVQADGAFDVSGVMGGNVAVNSLSGRGTVQLGANNLTLANARDQFDGVISGTGGVTVANGNEIFTGNNNYTGATMVTNGSSLEIDGNQTGATGETIIDSRSTLSGIGTIGGNVTALNGSYFEPGTNDATGTMNINGNLVLQNGSIQKFGLGDSTQPGGAYNDLVNVKGDLTLGGVLNVIKNPTNPNDNSSNLGAGIYRIYNYGGKLTNNNEVIGSAPTEIGVNSVIQTSVDHQVNLVVDDKSLQFWKQTGNDDTGKLSPRSSSLPSGVWTGSVKGTGVANWTNMDGTDKGSWNRGNFAIFQGNASNVIVKNETSDGTASPVKFSGMQFANNDGKSYVVTGDNLYTSSSQATIRVGDGTRQGSSITANLDTAINDANIKGGSDLVKADAGTLRITADQNYHGETVIEGGNLEADADLSSSSSVSVGANGKLSGNGQVGNVTVLSGGVVSAGTVNDPTGELDVSGDLKMNAGSHLQVNAASAPAMRMSLLARSAMPQNDADGGINNKIYVNGLADLTNANVDVNFDKDLKLRYGQSYTFLVANKGVKTDGAHLRTNISDQYAFLDPTLGVKDAPGLTTFDALQTNLPEEAYVYMARNRKQFESFAKTRNEHEVGRVLDGLKVDDPVAIAAEQIYKGQERRGLNSFSGEIHASARTALIQDSFYVREAALNRLALADCDGVNGSNGISTADAKTGKRNDGKCESSSTVLWGEAYGSRGNNSGDGNASSMHHSSTGFIMGVDTPVFNSWRIGGLISYGRSMFDTKNTSSSGYSNNATVGSYAGTHWGHVYLRLGVAYSWNMMNIHHTISYDSERKRSDSNYRAGTAQTFGEVGYRFQFKNATIEPFANVAYVNLDTDKFKESGTLGLRGKNSDTGVTFSTFGVHMMSSFKATQHMTVKPYATIAYRHAFGLLTPTVHEMFRQGGGSGTMDIAGVPLSKDSALVDAGFSLNVTDSMDLKLSYIGQYGNQSVDSGGRAELSVKF